jgi:hypothetical protein
MVLEIQPKITNLTRKIHMVGSHCYLCMLVKLILLTNHDNIFEMIVIFMMLTRDFILMKCNFDKYILML